MSKKNQEMDELIGIKKKIGNRKTPVSGLNKDEILRTAFKINA